MNDSRLGESIFGGEDATGPQVPQPAPARPARSRREARERGGPADPPQPPVAVRGAGRQRRDPEDRRPAIRGCLALLIGALIAGAVLIFAVSTLGSSFLPSFRGGSGGDYAGSGAGAVQITIAPGDSGTAIGSKLQSAGVVRSAGTFTELAASEPRFAQLQPGVYRLRARMSSAEALTLLISPGSKVSGGVTIPEGLWATEIYARLAKATKVPVASYSKVPVASLGLPAAANGRVEGYLFPSTYDFPTGASAQKQLQAMVGRFKQQATSIGIPADQLGRVTTVASLVQAEASRSADNPKVARVIDNRIAKKTPLQLDSTVNYLLRRRGNLTTSGSDRGSSSPYNTYKTSGLPPTPIDNPGADALRAALRPAAGGWMFFVTVDPSTGETVFSTTDTEHTAAVKRFQAWCMAHPGQC